MTRLGIESLEDRRLLAADVSLSDEGVLIVDGTNEPDTVEVSSIGDRIVVKTNGADSRTFAASRVEAILFSGRDGDDTFVNRTDVKSIAYGNEGNDRLVGGSAKDKLFGGPGNDTLAGRRGEDELHGDYGDDHLIGGEGDDDLRGWYGDDTLVAGDGDDYASGYKGNDKIWGGNGDDVIKGHEGDDLLFGDAGDDRIYGWKGDDLLVGGVGDDYLSGWSGNDILVGGKGNDKLRGHSGRDLLIGGQNADSIDGGSGEDFVITGWTKYDRDLAKLDSIMADWCTEDTFRERVNGLNWFIRSRCLLKAVDGKVDQMVVDPTGQPDLFVFDHKDFFVE